MRAFFNSINDFKDHLDSAIFLSIPALIGILLTFLFSKNFYLAIGSVFLRSSDILYISFYELLIAIFVVIFSISMFSFTVIGISLLVKEKRTHVSVTSKKFLNSIKSYMPSVVFFYFVLFIISFILQFLSLYINLLPLFHVLLFLFFGLMFFVPFAISIDDYPLLTAIRKSFSLTIKRPFAFVFWFLFNFIVIVVISSFLFFFLSYEIANYIIYIVSSLLILPFSTILAAHLYMDKYPLS
jgi:hypothetical protein